MKVTSVKVSTKDDKFRNKFNIVDRLKCLINFEMLFGLNRTYLLDGSKARFWVTQLSTPFILLVTIYLMLLSSYVPSVTYIVSKNAFSVEFLFLSFSGSYFQRNNLKSFFKKLNEFDTKLNLENALISPRPITTLLWTCAIIGGAVGQYILMNVYQSCISSYYLSNIISLGVVVRESEMLFFCTLLYTVFVRVRILKHHVAKAYAVKEEHRIKSRGISIENLSHKANLDTSHMQDAYELLHSSSEDLNASMSFAMIVMIFSSGILNTMFLKYGFNNFEIIKFSKADSVFKHVLRGYMIFACLKLVLLIAVPCYLSSRTAEQVAVIRRILNDVLARKEEDKLERRKVKAFYQLTRGNDFAYVLWGLIRLDMSLPLSYSGLCVTYLIIVLQFDKFFN